MCLAVIILPSKIQGLLQSYFTFKSLFTSVDFFVLFLCGLVLLSIIVLAILTPLQISNRFASYWNMKLANQNRRPRILLTLHKIILPSGVVEHFLAFSGGLAAINLIRNAFPPHALKCNAISGTVFLQGLLFRSDVYYDQNGMMLISVDSVRLFIHHRNFDIQWHGSSSNLYLVNSKISIQCSDYILEQVYLMPE